MRSSFSLTLFLTALASCAAPKLDVDSLPPGSEVNVGILLVDGTYNTELFAPIDVFHHVRLHAQPGTKVFTVGGGLNPVTTFEGQRVLPDFTFDGAPPIDVLVIPAAEGSMAKDLEDGRLLAWVRERAAKARWVLSLCDGAFVLAAAGLLDGRIATTFPEDVAALRAKHPDVTVRENVSFVRDGRIVTSAGGAKSFDAALYLTELLWGESVARAVGRGLCVDWGRDRVRFEARGEPSD